MCGSDADLGLALALHEPGHLLSQRVSEASALLGGQLAVRRDALERPPTAGDADVHHRCRERVRHLCE